MAVGVIERRWKLPLQKSSLRWLAGERSFIEGMWLQRTAECDKNRCYFMRNRSYTFMRLKL